MVIDCTNYHYTDPKREVDGEADLDCPAQVCEDYDRADDGRESWRELGGFLDGDEGEE